jgi:hypothetical protein
LEGAQLKVTGLSREQTAAMKASCGSRVLNAMTRRNLPAWMSACSWLTVGDGTVPSNPPMGRTSLPVA